MSMAQEIPSGGMTAADLEAQLHSGAAIQMLRWLDDEDITAGKMQAILRFLKDNDVTALPIPGSATERIASKLQLPFRITDAGIETEGSGPGD